MRPWLGWAPGSDGLLARMGSWLGWAPSDTYAYQTSKRLIAIYTYVVFDMRSCKYKLSAPLEMMTKKEMNRALGHFCAHAG